MLSEPGDFMTALEASHDDIDHTGRHNRSVRKALLRTKVLPFKMVKDSVTSQLRHADLERQTGSKRRLVEKHKQGLVW